MHNEATYGRGETIRVGCNNWYVGVRAQGGSPKLSLDYMVQRYLSGAA